MTTKVLFVYPNERGMSTVPPSIALLSKLLKNKGHFTALFDTTYYEFDDDITVGDKDVAGMEGLNFRQIPDIDDEERFYVKKNTSPFLDFRNQIESFSPDLLAVSCTETTFLRGYRLIEATRDLGIKNVFGGVFPTFAPSLVIENECVDMLCVGEGENAILELADRLDKGNGYSDVTNLWVKMSDGQVIKNRVSSPVDIDELPKTYDYALFGEQRFYRPMGGKIRRLLPVETHRGCPYTCSFCNSPAQNRLYGDGDFSKGMKFFRKKSLDHIKAELESHIEEWDVGYIYFWADTFLAWSNREFEEFCDMYSEIKLPFWCQTRVETVRYHKMERLKQIGLDRITFGMEHGNEEFRSRVIKRDYTNTTAINNLNIVKDLDITFSVNNIIGFPDETRELAFDTIRLNKNFDSDSVSCSIFVPFHGTDLRRYAELKGYIQSDYICTNSNADDSVLSMPQWESEDISSLRKTFAMYVKFPEDRWPEIKKGETDPVLFERLRIEFIEKFWGADPDGIIENDLAEEHRELMQ